MNAQSESQRGLSVLEVLIAIAILAGMAMALAPAVSASSRAASRIHESAATREALRTAGAFFRETVEQGIAIGTEAEEYWFVGDERSLTFPSVDSASADPVLIRLEVKASTLTASGPWLGELNEAQPILDRLSTATFDYYGDQQDGSAPSWQPSWNAPNAPKLIRISGVLKGAREDRPFLFEAAPGSETFLNCRFDPVSRVCR